MSFKDKTIVINLNRKNLIVLIIIIGLAFFTVTTYVNAMLAFRPSTMSPYAPPPSGGGGRANRNPVADAGPDQRAYVNQTVFFDGSGSSDPDGVIVNYRWSFGDGSYASGVNATHVYSSEGEYSVVLTVTDDDGATTSDTSIATIVVMTIEEMETLLPEEAAGILEEMNIMAAVDILEVAVSLNQSEIISETLLEMECETSAAILVEVESRHGAEVLESMMEINITGCARIMEAMIMLDVENVNIIVEQMDTDVLVELLIEVSLLTSSPSTVAAIFEAMSLEKILEIVKAWVSQEALQELGIVFGYLTSETLNSVFGGLTTTDRAILYPYLSAETISAITVELLPLPDLTPTIITVSSLDSRGYTVSTIIKNQGIIEGNMLKVDLRVGTSLIDQFEIPNLSPNASTIMDFNWMPATKGAYTLNVVVDPDNLIEEVDETNNELTKEYNARLPNNSPVAKAAPPQRINVNEKVFFDGSGSSDPDGVIVNYRWSFGDGSYASGVNVTHVYSSEGEYSVVLTVTDDDGATTSDTSIVTIEALTPLLRDEVVISAVLVVFIIIFVLGIFLRWWY